MLPYNVCCPECRSELQETGSSIICSKCDISYRREYGIPIIIAKKTMKKYKIQDRMHEQAFHNEAALKEHDISHTDLMLSRELNLFELSTGEILDALGFKEGNKELSILEVGCGMGYHTGELKKRGYRVVSCDLSVQALRINSRFNGIENIICCDLLELPFEDASFDYCFCFGVLHHFKSPAKAINEIFRVSSKGFISLVPNGNNLITQKMFRGIAKILFSESRSGTKNEIAHSIKTYHQCCVKSGFSFIKIVPSFPMRKKIFSKHALNYFQGWWMRLYIIIRNMVIFSCWKFLPASYGGTCLLIRAQK